MEEKVVATIENLEETIFSNDPKAFVLLAEIDSQVIGFVLYFYNYSTFLCAHGIYIEDIYVKKDFRGFGVGKAFFKKICEEAAKKDCGRVEWWCLDWNKPSIDFYLKLGAQAMGDWTTYRLNKDEIKSIAHD